MSIISMFKDALGSKSSYKQFKQDPKSVFGGLVVESVPKDDMKDTFKIAKMVYQVSHDGKTFNGDYFPLTRIAEALQYSSSFRSEDGDFIVNHVKIPENVSGIQTEGNWETFDMRPNKYQLSQSYGWVSSMGVFDTPETMKAGVDKFKRNHPEYADKV